MSPQEYIEKYYKQDLGRFKQGVICGATMSQFYEEKEKWPHLNYFLICQYELNLLSQLIYTYFLKDHEKWLEISLPFIDCRCASHHGGVNNPLSILWVAERDLNKKGVDFSIDKFLILDYDKFFWEYVKDKCEENNFIKLSPNLLAEVIKKDPDCNSEQVRKYLGY